MHTGYDSYWMYQNNRHEPVLNLPKNDNYSPAVLTDCYKQVQNGGRPSYVNSYMPTQNNIATSYPNGQHRTPGSQYIWSSSVYSQPLKPSYVSNFHPQESCSTQSNSLGYQPPTYSQAQQSNLRYFKNPDTSVSQMCNRQNNSDASVTTRDNYSNNQTPRIRVKDLFTLNNSTASNQVQNPTLYEILQKKQHEPPPNYAAVNHNITCNSAPQRKFGNYGEGNLLQSDPTLHYRTTAREQLPRVSPNSNLFYPQNTQAQLQFANGRQMQMQRNFNLEGSAEKSVPGKTLNGGNNQGSDIPNDRSESLRGCKSVKVIQKRNLVQINNPEVINNSGYVNNSLINDSCNQNNLCQVQNQQMEIVETSLYRSNKSTVTKADSDGSAPTDVRTSSFVSNNGQKNTVIKISIPHSGESTFLTISDCNSVSNDSNLSLTALLESNDQSFCGWNQSTSNKNTRENLNVPGVQPVKTGFSNPTVPSNVNHISNTSPNPVQSSHNPESVHRQISTVPPRKRFCRVVEPFINVNTESVEEFLKSSSDFEVNLRNFGSKVNSGSSRKDENIVKETVFQNDITLNTLKLKQEKFTSKEDPATEQQIRESAVLLENIKTEGNRDEPEMEDYETPSSEDRTNLDEPLASVVEVTENIEFTKADIEKFVFPSAPAESSFVKDSENSAQQEKTSSSESRVEDQKKLTPPEGNYKSKINRDKLDMLIQFLEKDEEPSQISLKSQTKRKKSCNNQRKKDVDLNHNRRKLSKTCVVKNKNNSREMISMVSHKTSRSELIKSSEKPRTMKPSSASNKVEEMKADSAEEKTKPDDNLICSDKPVTFKPASENSTQVKDNSTPESKNEFVTKHHQTCKEFSLEGNCDSQKQQNIINIIQALQILESIFCKSCDLVSTLDSFWINVASGELRCLNCFKKMRLEIDANLSKTSEAKVVQNDKTENRTEKIRENTNVLNDTSRCKWSSKLENAVKLTKNVTEEAVESMKSPKKENTANYSSGYAKKETFGSPKTSRRHSSSSEERVRSLEEFSVKSNTSKEETATHKMKHSEDVSKPETKDAKFKKKDSVSKETCTAPKNSTSVTANQVSDAGDKSERKHVEEHSKREKKGTESSSQSRKRSDSKDFTSLKSSEEPLRDETKVNSSDKSVKRKENYNSTKVNTAEQSTRKSTKCEQFEKTKTRSPPKESCTCHKSKALEETKSSSTEESKVKLSSNNSEKQKKIESVGQAKKRKNSDHDFGALKVRILEEHTKKDSKTVSYRTNETDTLKQEISRHKFTHDTQNTRNPADKLKRNGFSKEEHSKKESKQAIDSVAKDIFKGNKTHQKLKAHEQTKQKKSDFSDVPRRKSKEAHGVKQVAETLDVQKRKTVSKEENEVRTHMQEITKRDLKHENRVTENKDKKQKEEREKNHSFGKIPKTINLDNREKVIPSEQPRNSDTMYKALKENQNMKTNTTSENRKIGKDSHKDRRDHKNNWEDRKEERKIREKETSEIDFRGDVDSDKKKHTYLSEGKCDKSQTENKHLKNSDKSSVSSGTQKPDPAMKGNQESVGSKHSAVLLAKLMRKTKKLSWSLLGEA